MKYMLDKTVEQLFESGPKVRLLKLFLMNPEAEFTLDEAKKITELAGRRVAKELKKMMKMGLVGTKIVREIRLIEPKRKKARRKKRRAKKEPKPKTKTVKKRVFFVKKEFPLYPELRNLVFKIAPGNRGALLLKIKTLGDMKLAVLAGVFIKDDSSRADLVLVGDRLKKSRILSFIKKLQSEIGRELNYAVMTTPEFRYRLEMNDRFVRDVLDFPHENLINKLGI